MSVLERDRHGEVEILTLNRPEKRNALNKELLTTLAETFAELEADDAVKAIVLTGAGDHAFCRGDGPRRVRGGWRRRQRRRRAE